MSFKLCAFAAVEYEVTVFVTDDFDDAEDV